MAFAGHDNLRLAEIELTRRGAPPDASKPILGEWVGTSEMSGLHLEARYIFYSTGKCLFLLPFRNGSGHYSIRGSTMRLELPDQKETEGKFQIERDVLTTPGQGGSGYRFRRY